VLTHVPKSLLNDAKETQCDVRMYGFGHIFMDKVDLNRMLRSVLDAKGTDSRRQA